MAEDIWEELWEGIEWGRITTIPFITERIHKIKAEGDRLKDKLEEVKIWLAESHAQGYIPISLVISLEKILGIVDIEGENVN